MTSAAGIAMWPYGAWVSGVFIAANDDDVIPKMSNCNGYHHLRPHPTSLLCRLIGLEEIRSTSEASGFVSSDRWQGETLLAIGQHSDD